LLPAAPDDLEPEDRLLVFELLRTLLALERHLEAATPTSRAPELAAG
jgi:hypothetical protein